MAAVLTSFWLWSFVEGKFVARKAQQHKDHPIPARPTVTTEDVTVIIPTIDTPSTFPLAMSSVLKNKPLEVIIVTIERDYARVTELLSQVALDDDSRDIPIQVFTVELPPGKRKQMAAAIPKARGKITAQADDDVVWGPTLLQHLVAPFEDPKVGCSSGFQAAYIPPERRNTKVVTGWEIAAWYSLRGRGPALLGQHAVDGGIMCADGRTVLYRTAILQDKAFLRAFMNDRFRGRFMDSGEDIWVTRWLDVQGWKHGLQAAPEAAILSNVEETSKYVSQRVRWERSTIRTCLQFVCEPGLWRNHPNLGRLVLLRLLRVPLTMVYLGAWVVAFKDTPRIALGLTLYCVLCSLLNMYMCAKEHPFCASKIWVLPLMDQVYIPQDIMAWLTLTTENWGNRQSVEEIRQAHVSNGGK